MTARFALTRTSDAAERIIARFLGGADIAFASRRPFGVAPAASAAGEPVPDSLSAGLVHCTECNIWAERLCARCEANGFDHGSTDSVGGAQENG